MTKEISLAAVFLTLLKESSEKHLKSTLSVLDRREIHAIDAALSSSNPPSWPGSALSTF